jgi:hypothetical protein
MSEMDTNSANKSEYRQHESRPPSSTHLLPAPPIDQLGRELRPCSLPPTSSAVSISRIYIWFGLEKTRVERDRFEIEEARLGRKEKRITCWRVSIELEQQAAMKFFRECRLPPAQAGRYGCFLTAGSVALDGYRCRTFGTCYVPRSRRIGRKLDKKLDFSFTWQDQ